MTGREKRYLLLLAIAVPVILILRFTFSSGSSAPVAAAVESVPQAERRLARLRQVAALVPGKETILKNVSAELAEREKALVAAETAQQAQAQIQQVVHLIGAAQGIEVRGAEFGPVKPLANDYGEAPVSVSFDCAIEQLVNFLAALSAQPQMLGTSDIRISATNSKDKRINVRLTVSGVVARKLVPEKKGPVSF